MLCNRRGYAVDGDRPSYGLRPVLEYSDTPFPRGKENGPVNARLTDPKTAFRQSAYFSITYPMEYPAADQPFGALIRQIVKRSSDGVHVKELGDHPGHVCINRTVRYLAKRSKSSGPSWRFTFTPDELETLFNDLQVEGAGGAAHVILDCGRDCTCLLKSSEWKKLLKPSEINGTEWMQIYRPSGCQMAVRATTGRTLDYKVPQSRFPDMLLERGAPVPGGAHV